MIIVIDAYNFIKHISQVTFVSDKEKQYWIKIFQKYGDMRGNDVLFVFDAGPGLYQVTEHYKRLTVVYSGQMQTADDVIKAWLQQRQGQDILLVTSDRDICAFANRVNIVSIGSDDFYQVFTQVMENQEVYEEKVAQTAYKVTEDQIEGLDELMEMGSRDLVDRKEDEIVFRTRSNGKSSKFERKLLRKVEKI